MMYLLHRKKIDIYANISLFLSYSEVTAFTRSDGAEPPEAAVLASAPFMVVVAPSNVLSACHVAVKETITTVEPPEAAATAAEPSEGVSGIYSPTLCLSCRSQKGCP